PPGARSRRAEARTDGPGGGERGVRAAVSGGGEGARPRARPHQRGRRRDRAGAPARGVGRSHHRAPLLRARPPRRAPRRRLGLHRRRARHRGGAGARVMDLSEKDFIYDWNSVEKVGSLTPGRTLEFFDETLRDGIQSPSVVDPKIEDKLKIVQLASDLGIHAMDVGLPGAGRRAVEDVTRIVEYMRDNRLPVKPGCAARTVAADILPIVDISQKTGVDIEVLCFIGSSPVRLYAEGWDLDGMMQKSAEAIDL